MAVHRIEILSREAGGIRNLRTELAEWDIVAVQSATFNGRHDMVVLRVDLHVDLSREELVGRLTQWAEGRGEKHPGTYARSLLLREVPPVTFQIQMDPVMGLRKDELARAIREVGLSLQPGRDGFQILLVDPEGNSVGKLTIALA